MEIVKTKKDVQTLAGTISISRFSGGSEEEKRRPIRIYIVDDISDCQVVEVSLSLEEFASALTGYSSRPCILQGYNGPIGQKAENKEEIVPAKRNSTEVEIVKALIPFEVDGWKARTDDINNHHRWVSLDGKPASRVVFFRHVPVERRD